MPPLLIRAVAIEKVSCHRVRHLDLNPGFSFSSPPPPLMGDMSGTSNQCPALCLLPPLLSLAVARVRCWCAGSQGRRRWGLPFPLPAHACRRRRAVVCPGATRAAPSGGRPLDPGCGNPQARLALVRPMGGSVAVAPSPSWRPARL